MSNTHNRTDCAGHYKLCVTLKTGDANNPQAADCAIVSTCAEGDYSTAGQAQSWPALPGWSTPRAQLGCAQQFQDHGGYGELRGEGTALGCGQVGRVFTRIRYCPLTCRSMPNGVGCTDRFSANNGSF